MYGSTVDLHAIIEPIKSPKRGHSAISCDPESKLFGSHFKVDFIPAYLIILSDFDLHSVVNNENVAAISAAQMDHESLFTSSHHVFFPPSALHSVAHCHASTNYCTCILTALLLCLYCSYVDSTSCPYLTT